MKSHELVLGNYKFTFTLKHEAYSCESYSGVIFYTEGGARYDVVNNPLLGFRLIISEQPGWCREIPFKPETFSFLPSDIKVEEV
jgi:hypothetical protein